MEKRDSDINYSLNKLNDKMDNINETLRFNLDSISNRGVILRFFILIGLILVPFSIDYSRKKYDKAIVVNGDNAVIFDVTSEYFVKTEGDNVIYVDEDKGISANDIAISLVGEDGMVTYYNSETAEKVLINK